mgnify:FL=1
MIVFVAIYFYFLIQIIMASKWKDSLASKEIKNKLSTVPATVKESTKSVENKISDESVIVIENAKKLTKKAWSALKQWKDFVVDKYNNLKTKLNNDETIVKKWTRSEKNIEEWLISDLIKTNQELIDLTKKLIDKYDENLKLLQEINRNLSKKK